MVNVALLVAILVGGTVLAGAVVFMLFYMIQMRSSDRASYREIHKFIEVNTKAIRQIRKDLGLFEGDEPGEWR